MTDELEFGFKKHVPQPVGVVRDRVAQALSQEGFGVLTEIDVAGTFAAKLGADFRPYRILGACNPKLAKEALGHDLDIGLLLPCNVVVYEGERPGTSVVAVLDPVAQLGVSGRADVADLAVEVRSRMERVLEAL